jgi:hypothetical protein
VQDRERLAPVALPAEEPVTELVLHVSPAKPFGFELEDDPILGFGRGEAVERDLGAGAVDGDAFTLERLPEDNRRLTVADAWLIALARARLASQASSGITTARSGRPSATAKSKSR